MAEKQDSNQIEQQLYEAAVEEAVDKVSRLAKDKVDEADLLIDKFVEDAELQGRHAVTFKGEVLRKVTDKKQAAEDMRERQILEKFEGLVKAKSGELKFAGIEEDAKFYARGGNLYRRVFGKRYNASDVGELLDDVQSLENEIEEHKLEIEMLKASMEASKNVLRNARFMFKQKRKSRIFGGYFKDAANSLSAAYSQKQRTKAEYATRGKEKIRKIEKESRLLEKKQAVVDKLRAKIDARRQNGREVFSRQFGQQVEVLKQMSGDLYKQEAERLRKDVRGFGKDAGIVHFEFFLNQALGIEPKEAGYEEKEGVDKTPMEVAKEKAGYGRWLAFALGKTPSAHIVNETFDVMKNRMPADLENILKSGGKDTKALELRFLFSGKDTTGAPILEESRRANTDPETIVRFYKYAKDHKINNEGELQKIFETFAKEWPRSYTAKDFDYDFPLVKEGKKPPHKEYKEAGLSDAQKKDFENVWQSIFGGNSREIDMWNFTRKMEQEYPQNFGEEIANFLKAGLHRDLMKFFFSGEFGGKKMVADSDKYFKEKDVDGLIKAYKLARSLLKRQTPDKKDMKSIFKKLQQEAIFRSDGMEALTPNLFDRLYKEVQNENKKKS